MLKKEHKGDAGRAAAAWLVLRLKNDAFGGARGGRPDGIPGVSLLSDKNRREPWVGRTSSKADWPDAVRVRGTTQREAAEELAGAYDKIAFEWAPAATVTLARAIAIN